MQDHSTDAALVHAVDPGSNRLTDSDVIAIHRAHRDGCSWEAIARTHRTNRKNIQRIVQGRRHRDLHPVVRPDLYNEAGDEDEVVLTAAEVEKLIDDVMNRARVYVARTLEARRPRRRRVD